MLSYEPHWKSRTHFGLHVYFKGKCIKIINSYRIDGQPARSIQYFDRSGVLNDVKCDSEKKEDQK